MEKYIIASDIHGSSYWCARLLDAIALEEPTKVILLGDLLYHGPRNPLPDGHNPQEVAKLLTSVKKKLVCVRGNCDAEVDQMVLPFPMMADYALLSLQNGRTVYATHGHLANPKNIPPLEKGTLLLNGHTHVPTFEKLDGGIFYANCGSVALPKEDTPHSYLVLEEDTLSWKDLESGGVFDIVKL